MKIFLKILAIVVATLLVLAISILAYVLIENPLGIGTLIRTSVFGQEVQVNVDEKGEPIPVKNFDHPLLSDEQEKAAKEAGIDVTQIPTEVTEAQAKCALEKLGETRIREISAGASPTAGEVIKLLPCAGAE